MPVPPGTDSSIALPAPRLYVRLLGGLEIEHGSLRLQRLPSRAIVALLARLALAPGRVHAREELVELLWPGVELAVGRNRLRQALSTLKSLIEPHGEPPLILADRLGLRVAPGAIACDAGDFEAAVRGRRWADALALYRGELLPGHYDEWIAQERLQLAAWHERATAAAAELSGAGNPAPPTAAHRRPGAAAASAASDGPAEALRAAAVRVTLPSYLTRMFGAEAQAARLRERVLAHRLVTLIGPGGCGKTRLAVEVAHSLRPLAGWPSPVAAPDEPFDLIAFVPLVTCRQRGQVLDALAGCLRIAPGREDAPRAVLDALHGRRALLVLDNFEQLAGQAETLVAQLLAELPMLHLLVTSRRALGIDGENELAMRTLDLPPAAADAAAAVANPAVALFVERARAVRADFHLGARNARPVVALVRVLQGMPLAIELAASRVRSIAPAEMLQRLTAGGTPQLDLLARSGASQAVDPRHASMQRTIAWSWNLLDERQRRLLLALTVFPAGFTAAAATLLMAGEPVDAALVLDDLVAQSLVQALPEADSEGESFRFTIYQPIREFALAQGNGGSLRHWRLRLRAWAAAWVDGLPTTPPLAALRAEMPNLVAALATAVDDDDAADEAVTLLLRLRRCLEDVELPAEGLVHAEGAVERCADAVLKARGHSLIGPLLLIGGRADAALRHAEAGLQCDALAGVERARALHALARVRWRSRRRAAGVEPLLDEAQALIAGRDEPELQASVLALRAFVTNAHHRDPVAGERLHAQALALWQQVGNRHAIHSGLYNLAVCAENQHRPALAVERLTPLIAEARAGHDWRRLSQSLNVRGNARTDLRQWPQALADYQECIRTAWQNMAQWDLAFGLWNVPRVLLRLRQTAAALRLAGFAARYWRSRFGELDAHDLRYLRRLRRMAARSLEAASIDALWREGEQLGLAQAVELALSVPRGADANR